MTKRKGASGSPSRTPVLMVKGSVSPDGVTTETVVSLYKIYCVNNSGGNSIGDKNLKHSRAINGVKGFSKIDKRDDWLPSYGFTTHNDSSEGEDMSRC